MILLFPSSNTLAGPLPDYTPNLTTSLRLHLAAVTSPQFPWLFLISTEEPLSPFPHTAAKTSILKLELIMLPSWLEVPPMVSTVPRLKSKTLPKPASPSWSGLCLRPSRVTLPYAHSASATPPWFLSLRRPNSSLPRASVPAARSAWNALTPDLYASFHRSAFSSAATPLENAKRAKALALNLPLATPYSVFFIRATVWRHCFHFLFMLIARLPPVECMFHMALVTLVGDILTSSWISQEEEKNGKGEFWDLVVVTAVIVYGISVSSNPHVKKAEQIDSKNLKYMCNICNKTSGPPNASRWV